MQGQRFAFGPFVVNPEAGTLLREGVPVAVGYRGLLLLGAFARRPGEVLTKSDLLDAGWPGLSVEEGNLTVQIASLRKLRRGVRRCRVDRDGAARGPSLHGRDRDACGSDSHCRYRQAIDRRAAFHQYRRRPEQESFGTADRRPDHRPVAQSACSSSPAIRPLPGASRRRARSRRFGSAILFEGSAPRGPRAHQRPTDRRQWR